MHGGQCHCRSHNSNHRACKQLCPVNQSPLPLLLAALRTPPQPPSLTPFACFAIAILAITIASIIVDFDAS
jgi:hypothetical protein